MARDAAIREAGNHLQMLKYPDFITAQPNRSFLAAEMQRLCMTPAKLFTVEQTIKKYKLLAEELGGLPTKTMALSWVLHSLLKRQETKGTCSLPVDELWACIDVLLASADVTYEIEGTPIWVQLMQLPDPEGWHMRRTLLKRVPGFGALQNPTHGIPLFHCHCTQQFRVLFRAHPRGYNDWVSRVEGAAHRTKFCIAAVKHLHPFVGAFRVQNLDLFNLILLNMGSRMKKFAWTRLQYEIMCDLESLGRRGTRSWDANVYSKLGLHGFFRNHEAIRVMRDKQAWPVSSHAWNGMLRFIAAKGMQCRALLFREKTMRTMPNGYFKEVMLQPDLKRKIMEALFQNILKTQTFIPSHLFRLRAQEQVLVNPPRGINDARYKEWVKQVSPAAAALYDGIEWDAFRRPESRETIEQAKALITEACAGGAQ